MMTHAAAVFSEDERRQIAAMVAEWDRRAQSLIANAAEVRAIAGLSATPAGVADLSLYRARRSR
ncbi:hypothetical protein [Nonomuraea wenchangensis]|uniref:Uncharacterized protein n=1 Tax=Nonomuraea wenchangensis TaxID=568860 RepID=A0A1I0ENL0_9ACTN|nr:hypothetical protein [Nonomuraea wenchangensis]SET47049.1 hypothetical protein SAMN05421811_103140 [Nonomuraea wenchangensis]